LLQIDPLVGDCRDIHTEAALTLLQNYLESMMGTTRRGLRFSIAGSPCGHEQEYHRYLHGEVVFNARVDALHLPASWLDEPSPFADAELWSLSRQHLSQQLARATESQSAPFSRHLQTFFAAHTPPLPELQETADSLHLSTRTLNRRLNAESTTFRQLRLDATHEWARRLLAEGLSVEAVALQLGYDNPANFRRSFRTATGVSPSRWLQSASEKGDATQSGETDDASRRSA
jgi:AraC-like DNA-binding protein